MHNNIILSICIPTYNRAESLNDTIKSIISQDIFINTDDVEIIISDNCSEDNTEIISKNYSEQFPGKIKYFKNTTNIKDYNFEKALSRGTGEFLKLNNDTLTYNKSSLAEIVQLIKNYRQSKKMIFFSNGNLNLTDYVCTQSLDEFIDKVSFFAGWIGGFGIWKEDFEKINDFNRYAHLQWAQLDVIYRLISQKKEVLVLNKRLFSQVKINQNKGVFDFLTVYLENYKFILTIHYNLGNLSKSTIVKEAKKILVDHISYNLAKISVYPNAFYPDVKHKFSRIIKSTTPNYFTLFLFFIKYHYFLTAMFIKKKIKKYLHKY